MSHQHHILNNALCRAAVTCALATLTPLAGWAAGDAQAGHDVFSGQCAVCHSTKEGKNKVGPSLFAVVGRKSASITDFKYSDAMKSSNYTWSAEQLDAYVTQPKKVVPGNAMGYEGLSDAKARADLIAYLASMK